MIGSPDLAHQVSDPAQRALLGKEIYLAYVATHHPDELEKADEVWALYSAGLVGPPPKDSDASRFSAEALFPEILSGTVAAVTTFVLAELAALWRNRRDTGSLSEDDLRQIEERVRESVTNTVPNRTDLRAAFAFVIGFLVGHKGLERLDR